jgi:molybdate transport system regulatory protein
MWLEIGGEPVFGPGAYSILKAVRETGTITEGAKKLGMSYRYAWGVIRKIEKRIGAPLLETHKGGTIGGGGASVTALGLRFMEVFARAGEEFERVAQEASKKRS